MSKKDDLSAEHIQWLVRSRTRNQEVALKILLIMKDHQEHLQKTKRDYNIAQTLVAVNFSLWRAVFLTDITNEMDNFIEDTTSFLGNLILHNAVAYPQDRNTREWTFRYYANNARYRLDLLSKTFPKILPPEMVEGKTGTVSKDFWAKLHTATESAVRNFETSLINAKNEKPLTRKTTKKN